MGELEGRDEVVEGIMLLSRQMLHLTEQLAALIEHVGAPAPPPELMTTQQVAQMLGVAESWVQGEARAGRIRHRRIGRSYRFARSDLDDLVERSLKEPPEQGLLLSARSLAALRRNKREGRAPVTPRRLGPFDPPGIPDGAIPDPSRPRMVRVVCPATGRYATASGSHELDTTVDCPECGRPFCTLRRFDAKTRRGTITRHVLYLPVADLTPEHVLWPGGERGSQQPPIPAAAPTSPPSPPADSGPPAMVRCPGSGRAVNVDKGPVRCPSCQRADLTAPRFSPLRNFGLLPAHGKTVPADSEEAELERWQEPTPS
ncbi:helix-turn-helix domain-containing protein [Kineococcus sp. SYSU DK005]|uniref:helix-turn-helix domain-containing protein n=1 Tax=Kineococcus sp. SYSU DK005 TaxID=3383126 RepID=UPI003D7D3A27